MRVLREAMGAALAVPEIAVIIDAGVSGAEPDLAALAGLVRTRRNGKPVHGAQASIAVLARRIIIVRNIPQRASPSYRAAGRAGAVRMPINDAEDAWAQIAVPAQQRSVRDRLKSRQ